MTRRAQKAVVAALGLCLLGSAAHAGEARLNVAGMTAMVPVRSLEARKFETIIRQSYDFSCGSAALATLLTYHYGRPHSETDVFDKMWAVGDQENIKAKGFSLLDMKVFLETQGLKADGFRIPLDKLRQVGIPTITLIVRKGYAHFVVLRGIADDYVVVGDPALGALTIPRAEFEQMWNGIAFAIHNEATSARQTFNLVRDLPFQRRASLGTAINRSSLAMITVLLPGENEVR